MLIVVCPIIKDVSICFIGQYYRGDQLLNIQAFSCLRQWLLFQDGNAYSSKDERAEGTTERQSSSPLSEASLQYAMRIIEQSSRSKHCPTYIL